MRCRNRLWLILVVVALGGFLPAVAAAPAAHPRVEVRAAEGGHGITVASAPRWGRSSEGQWTSYVVTARNDSGADFAGDLVLVPEPAPATAPVVPTTIRLNPADYVVALGETEITKPAPDAVVEPGAVTVALAPERFPRYRSPLTLAAGSTKTVSVALLEAPFGHRAELRDRTGNLVTVSDRPVQPGELAPNRDDGARVSAGPSGAVLVDVATAGDASAALEAVVGDAAVLRTPADLPSSALGLAGLQVLVLTRLDAGDLSPHQVRAIADFVVAGGNLVLTGGAGGRRLLQSLPEYLVPFVPTGMADASLASLADLVARSTTKVAGVLVGDVRDGTVILDTAEGVPLVVDAYRGRGRVIVLTYDPLEEPFVSDDLLRDVAWAQGMWRATMSAAGPVPGGGAGPDPLLWSPADDVRGWPGWPPLGVAALLSYVVVGFPLAYVVVRRRGRRSLVWVLAPGLAVVAVGTVAGTFAGREVVPPAAVRIETRIDADTALVDSYRGARPSGKGSVDLRIGDDVLASTVFAGPNPYAVPPDDFRVGGHGGGVLSRSGDGDDLSLEAEPAQVRAVQGLEFGRGSGLTSELRLVETGPATQGGVRVAGTVSNRSSGAVHKVYAQLPEGARARLADVVEPGQTVDVDAVFVWPSTIEAGKGVPAPAEQMFMYAAARRAFTHSGQVAVVGITGSGRSVPTPKAESSGERGEVSLAIPIEIVVEVSHLNGADRSVTNLLRTSAPIGAVDVALGQLAVYEHAGNHGVGPLSLNYGTEGEAPEVYDWVSRTWRRLPPGGPGHGSAETPLRDSEMGPEGLVRTRNRTLGTSRCQAGCSAGTGSIAETGSG